jgi:serine/threonine protein kinase
MDQIIKRVINFYSGAFSNVYKAIDKGTQQKVAIKVVRKRELNHSQVRALFEYFVRCGRFQVF